MTDALRVMIFCHVFRECEKTMTNMKGLVHFINMHSPKMEDGAWWIKNYSLLIPLRSDKEANADNLPMSLFLRHLFSL